MRLCLCDEQLFDVYCKEIRYLVEFVVPVWHPGLTKNKSISIERIKKLAFQIILQNQYTNYERACKHIDSTALAGRRENCVKNVKSKYSFFAQGSENLKQKQQTDVNEGIKMQDCLIPLNGWF